MLTGLHKWELYSLAHFYQEFKNLVLAFRHRFFILYTYLTIPLLLREVRTSLLAAISSLTVFIISNFLHMLGDGNL